MMWNYDGVGIMSGNKETDLFIRRLVAIGKLITVITSAIAALIVTIMAAF